jgi:protein involved in polysaccharide export with SLBB domain
MKRILVLGLIALLFMFPASLSAQSGLTDTQVLELIQSESKAGRTQAQIVTKLVQRGVTIDQIRRIRDQYSKQISRRNLTGVADAAVNEAANRMRTSNSGVNQEMSSGRVTTEDASMSKILDESNGNFERDFLLQQDKHEQDLLNTKKVFGRDIFNQQSLSFEPNMNIATPQDYVLGPGDKVLIDIYGASQKTLELTISPEGTITVPGFGPIAVSGMSVASANAKIRSQLGSRYSSSSVKLTVGQTRTIMVSVMGEVVTPGTYHLSAFATVFHALYMAGGISNIGTLRNIRVIRNGRPVTVVDIYEYILNGRLAGNIRLQEGDVVQVGPYDCLVDIVGSVKRPMSYEMRKEESVATLLKYAGGLTGDAYKKSVRLTRKTGAHYSVYTVDEFEQASFKLDDGDSVVVDGILDRYENTVEVRGAVFRPGQFQLGNEVTSVRSLVQQADGVTEDAFTARAVLHRRKEDRSLEVVPVDLGGILSGTVADIPLRSEDVLFVPTQSDLRQVRTLSIYGEVLSPGDYEYASNTTLEDLILQAGGLTDAASVVKVDVSRRIVDPKATEATSDRAKTYSFSIKDGFVIDGEAGFILEPYDIVQVRKSPAFQTPRQVSVEGEVTFEGRYTLDKKNMRLSHLVELAGGLTPDAYAKGARLIRTMNDDEKARMENALAAAKQSQDDKDSVGIDKLQTSDTFIVGIELDKALANPGSDYDIVIREKDRLVVPEYNGTIRVSGDVMFPNTVPYDEGKNYKWYVNKAGGFGQRAKKKKTYIVYQNGMIAQVGHGAKIEPGCEIIVPSKHKGEALTAAAWMGIGTSAASIASMIATIVYMTTR